MAAPAGSTTRTSTAGGFIATSLLQRKLLHLTPDGGSFTAREAADASALASFALNDLIRTSAGYTYVATLDFNFVDFVSGKTEARPSPIVGMSPEGTVFVATTEVTFPNGMAATPGDDRLLVADTLDACIYAFTIAKDGALVNRRVFASLPREAPDGMCLDAEGAVWVATHHRVLRVLEGGAITDEVEMGTPLATACMLGGADGRTLLVTASDSFDRRVISKTPSGRLFTVRVPVPGGGLPSTYA